MIYAEYNMYHNSIDVTTFDGYVLRIDCNVAEDGLRTTPGSQCALNALAIDEPLEYATLAKKWDGLDFKQFACAMESSDEDMSMKAVKRLGESCKNLFKLDNARVLLLEMAKDYLNHSKLEEDTDKQYGKGLTKYIGSAIYRYYGVENLE